VLVKHLTIRKATLIFGPERIVRGCVKNRLTLQRDNAAARGASKEICISDFGARPPSTVDRPGVITCLLKFLLDRLNRCRVKLSRVNGSWNHRPYCEKSYLLARKCSDSAPERSSLICKATRCILEILSTRDTRLVFEPECRLRPETLYGAMDTAALAPRHRAPWARKARHSIETLKILIPRPPKSFFEVPGSLRHLVRAGAPVLFCRLRARFCCRVPNDLAAERTIVAYGRSFPASGTEPVGSDPCIDGGKTVRRDAATMARGVAARFVIAEYY
jgi:hypothetical protein